MADTVFKVAYRTQYPNSEICVNTFHVAHDTDAPSDVCDDVDSAIGTQYSAVVPNDATTLDIKAVRVPLAPGDSGPFDEFVKNLNRAGTSGAINYQLSLGLTAVGLFDTGVASRRARGRFWCPPACDYTRVAANGTWNAAAGNWFDKCKTLLAAMVAMSTDPELCVYSKAAVSAGASNVYWGVTGYRLPNVQHFLRSRRISPE